MKIWNLSEWRENFMKISNQNGLNLIGKISNMSKVWKNPRWNTGWPKSKFPIANSYNLETVHFWPQDGKAKMCMDCRVKGKGDIWFSYNFGYDCIILWIWNFVLIFRMSSFISWLRTFTPLVTGFIDPTILRIFKEELRSSHTLVWFDISWIQKLN